MHPIPNADSPFLELLVYFGPRFAFSLLCGALIGLERELKQKAAGIKTNMLICMGACIFTSLSVLIAESNGQRIGDPGRLAAQVVSGIGFIGGGAILKERGMVLGVTTAAMIWTVAAIGVCIGLGFINIAVLMSIVTVLCLVLTTEFEDRILGRAGHFSSEILVQDDEGRVRKSINQALEMHGLSIEDFDSTHKGNLILLKIKYEGPIRAHKQFILELWKTPGIKEVRQV